MICDRCHQESVGQTGSWFNQQMICTGKGSCDEAEMAHPDFQKAKDADAEATRGGNFRFAGIGLPSDLG